MNQYHLEIATMSKDLEELLGAVMLHSRDLPKGVLVGYRSEPLLIALARKLRLVTTPRATFEVHGIRVQHGERLTMVITQNASSGELLLTMGKSYASRRLVSYSPVDYIRYVITDDRWVTMADAVAGFSRDYRVIADLLPSGHALHARATELGKRAAALHKP